MTKGYGHCSHIHLQSLVNWAGSNTKMVQILNPGLMEWSSKAGSIRNSLLQICAIWKSPQKGISWTAKTILIHAKGVLKQLKFG